MIVQFSSNVIMVHKNDAIEIPVNVTVLGSPSHNPSLSLNYGEVEPSVNSINRENGTQILRIRIPTISDCTASEIQVMVTTDDSLVEIQGNNMISIHLGKLEKHYQFALS